MTVARNLVANSLNQGVAFLVNIVAVPIYLSLLGVEQYGLVGFGLVVQTWINLLEGGMSGTLGREMTRFKAGLAGEGPLLSFLRSLDRLFLGGVVVLPLIGLVLSSAWAREWFAGSSIGESVISQSILLIVALAAVRLAGNLYRGGLMGLERQVFASWLSIVCSIARLAAPLPFVIETRDVRTLFAGWLLVSLIELVILRLALSKAFTRRLPWGHFSFAALTERTHIWGSIGIVSILWTAISQADKLILARLLPLAAYGEFTLVMVLSNAVLSIPLPIALAYQPRFTSAAGHDNRRELARLVHDATRLIVVVAIAPAIGLSLIPEVAIYAWTGSREAAQAVSSYAGIYLLGSALFAPATIAYCIQLAYGNLRLHVRVLGLGTLILIPAIFMAARRYGAFGAAFVWLAVNLLCFLFYDPVVIRRFLPGETIRWFGMIVLPLIAAAVVAFGTAQFRPDLPDLDRFTAISMLVGTELLSVAAAAAVTFLFWKREAPGSIGTAHNASRMSRAGEKQ